MKQKATKALSQLQSTFTDFTTGQKVVAVVGSAALLMAALFMFRWASTPSMTPLYTDLSASSAAQIVDELGSKGVKYELANGGTTVMVPSDEVYTLRLSLASAGVQVGNEGGYSILDKQGLSTSQFKEQTDFKRAMEGELAKTITAIDGVETAIVHLAMPERRVFQEEQDPTTASVLLATRYGVQLKRDQVQAITNLVASSIDGLSPDKVTVTDSTGTLLSAPADSANATADAQSEQVQTFQNQIQSRVQSMLDTVVGPGNSSVNVNADLSFDEERTEDVRYYVDPNLPVPPLSETTSSEVYNGANPDGTATGVVGPDGQMDATGDSDGNASYQKEAATSDNAVNRTTTQRVAAPGGVRSLHVGVALDSGAPSKVDPSEIQALVAAAVGINEERGDSLVVSSLPFDRSAAESAAAELKAAQDAAQQAELMSMLRKAAGVGLLLLVGLFVWLRSRRKNKLRLEATSIVVEQMRREAAERAAQQAALQQEAAAIAALEASNTIDDVNETLEVKQEIQALVESQPEDVAQLLRGWLVER